MPINREHALEIADKYLLYSGYIVLKETIEVNRIPQGWSITAKSIPMISSAFKETINFTIDGVTGVVDAVVTLPLEAN